MRQDERQQAISEDHYTIGYRHGRHAADNDLPFAPGTQDEDYARGYRRGFAGISQRARIELSEHGREINRRALKTWGVGRQAELFSTLRSNSGFNPISSPRNGYEVHLHADALEAMELSKRRESDRQQAVSR